MICRTGKYIVCYKDKLCLWYFKGYFSSLRLNWSLHLLPADYDFFSKAYPFIRLINHAKIWKFMRFWVSACKIFSFRSIFWIKWIVQGWCYLKKCRYCTNLEDKWSLGQAKKDHNPLRPVFWVYQFNHRVFNNPS